LRQVAPYCRIHAQTTLPPPIAGLSRIGEDAVDPPMQMLRAVPLVALASFFPVYITLFSGIRAVDNALTMRTAV